MAAFTKRTVPSVNSFTLPDTLTAVLLANPGACVTGARIFWVWLSRWWTGWRLNLFIVQPATVLAWHRQGFQLYWRWRS